MTSTFSLPFGRRRWPLPAALMAAATLVAFPAVTDAAAPLTLTDTTAPIGPGITLRHQKTVDATGWYDQQVLTVNLADPAVTTDLLAGAKVSGSSTTTSSKVNAAGAVAGTNGDFSDVNGTSAPSGAAVQNGTLLKGADVMGWDQVGVGRDGIGRLVDMTVEAKATFGGAEHPVLSLNTANFYGSVPAGSIVAYTSAWGTGRRISGLQTTTDVAEVLVQAGKVVAVNPTGADADPIPADGFALVGRDAAATAIRALHVGDAASLAYGLKDDVAKDLKFGIGANRVLVRDGAIQEGNLDPDSDKHPRTAIGFKDGGRTMLLITWEGRQESASGVSMRKEAEVLTGLGADIGLNLDGGGSTTMVARLLGQDQASVMNNPSDGSERAVPNGIGVFVRPGSGQVEDLVVTPASGESSVFPGLHRTLTAKAVDDHQTPVALPRGDVRWSTSDGTVDSGLLAAPKDATGTIAVKSTTDTAQATTKVRVLRPLRTLELSSERLSFAELASAPYALQVTGRDDQGFSAPVEAADLDLAYDHSVLKVTPSGTGLKITPVKNGGTVLVLKAAGQVRKLPVSVGVETTAVDLWKDAANDRWLTAGSGGTNQVLSDGADGLRLTFNAARNMGFTSNRVPADQVPLPGKPLRVRIKVTSTIAASLTYMALKDYGAVGQPYRNLYSGPIVPGTQWVEFTLPADTVYPIGFDTFQAIETNPALQSAGALTFQGLQVDNAPDVELPGAEPLRSDALISPDGKTNGKDDWHFATLSDVQFTASQPELAKVGIAALERIRQHKPDLVVLNGDITDRGLAEDTVLARQTLEAGGCDLIKVGEEPAADSTPDPRTGKVPCYYVPGNHESYGLGNVQATLGPWTAEFGRPYRTFDHKGTRFILLNSALGSLRGSDYDQLPMLRDALDSAVTDDSVRNVMVFAHHPVDDPAATKSSQLGDRSEVELVEQLLADFRARSDKGVSMVGSHAQIVDVHRLEGVPYTVLPSSGKAPYGTPERGGFTGWLDWSVDRDASAGQQWLTADVRAFSQETVIDAPATVEVSQAATLGGHIVQPSGVAEGTRVVPLAYPMSIHWSGDDALAIGSGEAAIAAARKARKVAILDPETRRLTGLRTGAVEVAVTNDSMREYTDEASLAPIRAVKTIQVVAYAGPGPRIDAPAPAFPAQPAGTTGAAQPITVSNTGDRPLHVGGAKIQRVGGSPAGEFVLAGDDCTDRAIAPGASCVLAVRFSPSAPDVTSDAELVLAADTPDRETVVALTGLSTVLAKGDKGDTGANGPVGPTGPTGAPGATGGPGAKGDAGAKGDTGASGSNGSNGAKGDTGAPGSNGAKGDKGDTGASGSNGAKGDKGDTGAAGKSASVKCTVAKSRKAQKVTCKVTYPKATSKRIAGRQASLTRGGRTYARGTVAALRTVRPVTRGTYTLRVKTSTKATTTYRVAVR